MQYIKEYEQEKISVIDWSKKTMKSIKEDLEEEAKVPFDFIDSKLYQFVIYKFPSNRTAIYIKLHHIIADAWVTKILLKQLKIQKKV